MSSQAGYFKMFSLTQGQQVIRNSAAIIFTNEREVPDIQPHQQRMWNHTFMHTNNLCFSLQRLKVQWLTVTPVSNAASRNIALAGVNFLLGRYGGKGGYRQGNAKL